MTKSEIFEMRLSCMNKTHHVCEICSSYLYYNGEDNCRYCPECDAEYLSQLPLK